MSETTDTAVSELLRERLRLDAELARYQQAVTVLFVDIVGSTHFYDQHGDIAGLAMVQKFLDQLTPIVQKHEGIVVKTLGDAILARFHTALDGVRCALAMQFALLEYNVGRPTLEQIHSRVALNAGYALIKDNDVFGDVVNVCSRIESAAKPDDILISPSVYDQICRFEEIAVRKRAEGVQLKGKSQKLDLYEVVWGLDEPVGLAPPPPSKEQVAMAALPQPADAAEIVTVLQPQAAIPAPIRRTRYRVALIGTTVIVVALALAGSLFLTDRKATALSEKDTIVLADFVNKTGDPVFDDTLKQALAVDLSQSPFLNVLSDRKIMVTLRLMDLPSDQRVVGQVARDLCQRVGSKALLAGSIHTLGKNYVIGLDAMNCATGDTLVKEQIEAQGKEGVLKALGRIATGMRGQLGESLASVQKFSTSIEEATTSSLDALKAYSVAKRTAGLKGDVAALPYFQRALELDPNFAAAYADMANSYSNLGQTARATENITKGYELRDRVSERERYRISAFYHSITTGDLDKANRAFELWKQSYPRDFVPRGDLGSNYEALGNWENALRETEAAQALEVNNAANVSNLAWEQLALSRTDQARTTVEQAVARGVEAYYLHLVLYQIAFLRGQDEEMQRQLAAVLGSSGEEDLLLSAQSDTEAFFGRLNKARSWSQRAVDSARRADAPETAALWQANRALREAEFGNRQAANQDARAAVALAPGVTVRAMAALALARAGYAAPAREIADELHRTGSQNTLLQLYWLPSINAALAVGAKNGAKAAEVLQNADCCELGQVAPSSVGMMYPSYLRGEAYLLTRHGEQAAAEFRKVLDRPGLVLNFPFGALAHMGLARAFLQQGERSKARAEYERFLTLWKDADPDIPILRQAKAEYAALE
ncbi:MAG: adenylate/guanylate cyclase domain-containing protein [Terriglobales bacterium]